MPPGDLVEYLALKKAKAVASQRERGLVIGADTIVTMEGKVLGKPGNPAEALDMLNALQGRVHHVYTGVAVIDSAGGREATSHVCTAVSFRRAGRAELEAYVATGEPMDKAGAYGIQGKGSVFIDRIEGCYFNVVGLPLAKLATMLQGFGIDVTACWRKGGSVREEAWHEQG